MKIGPADPEIIVLREIIKKEEKKKEINASKIYSPVGNLAERVKNVKVAVVAETRNASSGSINVVQNTKPAVMCSIWLYAITL